MTKISIVLTTLILAGVFTSTMTFANPSMKDAKKMHEGHGGNFL